MAHVGQPPTWSKGWAIDPPIVTNSPSVAPTLPYSSWIRAGPSGCLTPGIGGRKREVNQFATMDVVRTSFSVNPQDPPTRGGISTATLGLCRQTPSNAAGNRRWLIKQSSPCPSERGYDAQAEEAGHPFNVPSFKHLNPRSLRFVL